jgi:aminoglycoside phosphotransferase (APT) family kinase protein
LVHRDLHRNNVLRSTDGILLLDWDMSHVGRTDDDLATTVCCVVADSDPADRSADAARLVAAYREETGVDWALLEHPRLRASIALAGLRQGVAGWYSDEGDTSAGYWPRIRRRMHVAAELLA